METIDHGEDKNSIKLREEVHFGTFYKDLKENEDIGLVFLNDKDHFDNNNKNTEDIISSPGVKINKKTGNHNKNVKKIPIKQILFKNKTIFEAISSIPKVKIQNWPKDTTNYELTMMSNEYEKKICNTISKILCNQKIFQNLYDMNKQDFIFLQYLLNQYPMLHGKLTPFLFECLITLLENEWYQFDRLIPHDPHNLIKYSIPPWIYDKYGTDDGRVAQMDSNADQSCAVCGLCNSEPVNSIIFCDGCDIAVHQECYGVVFIPEGAWYCRKCMLLGNDCLDISCKFCPSQTGAFKQSSDGSWAHVICALWIPELTFANVSYMEPIIGEENIPKSRWKLTCFICRKKGCCIQCCSKNCVTAYHVTCAKRAGLYLNLEEHCSIYEAATGFTSTSNVLPDRFLATYCPKHQPVGWHNCENGILKTKAFYRDQIAITQQLIKQRESIKFKNSIDSQSRSGKTTISPFLGNLVREVLLQVFNPCNDNAVIKRSAKNKRLDDNNFIDTLSIEICKYWILEKEYNNGAFLIKKKQLSYDTKSYNGTELKSQKKFIETRLLKDLKKIDILSNLVVERQRQLLKVKKINNEILNQCFSPINYLFINEHLSKMQKLVNFERLCQDLKIRDFLNKVNTNNVVLSNFKEIYDAFQNAIQIQSKNKLELVEIEKYLNEIIKPLQNVDFKQLLNTDFNIDYTNNIVVEKHKNFGKKHQKLLGLLDIRKNQDDSDLSEVEDLEIMEKRTLNELCEVMKT
ncbi:uncharacterized protein SCODWIG_03875 [Saccharomycodes ludwigii]|uniref:NuA3 HAT complex component NTO1 n=1 Tax=Saccharomycodes ludwigii TaxID=36035 RepID=A0A376BBQ0_9ASCO|nr:uncharacterized protein SCODWIG_03875 [Saccharomycodes ludwigii]